MNYEFLKPLRNILAKSGYYKMANFSLAQEYVEILKEKGLDVHVVDRVGQQGVQNIIFMREKADDISDMLESQRATLSGRLFDVELALSKVHDLCIG